jgi:hypothetical protein
VKWLTTILLAVAMLALPLHPASGRGGGGGGGGGRGSRPAAGRPAEGQRGSRRKIWSADEQRLRDRREDRESARDCDRR